MRAILSRELQSYFYTPIGYVYMGVFLTLGSVSFAVNNLAARSGDVLTLLWDMSYLWLLLSPILTMRSYAGEKKARTDQLLFTSPVSLSGVVWGKFLAAAAVLLAGDGAAGGGADSAFLAAIFSAKAASFAARAASRAASRSASRSALAAALAASFAALASCLA